MLIPNWNVLKPFLASRALGIATPDALVPVSGPSIDSDSGKSESSAGVADSGTPGAGGLLPCGAVITTSRITPTIITQKALPRSPLGSPGSVAVCGTSPEDCSSDWE